MGSGGGPGQAARRGGDHESAERDVLVHPVEVVSAQQKCEEHHHEAGKGAHGGVGSHGLTDHGTAATERPRSSAFRGRALFRPRPPPRRPPPRPPPPPPLLGPPHTPPP